MSDMILAVAAYVCLAVGVVLLIVRLSGEQIKRTVGVWRFRRTLHKLDGVPAEWTRAMGAMGHLQEEPARRNRAGNRRQQHRTRGER